MAGVSAYLILKNKGADTEEVAGSRAYLRADCFTHGSFPVRPHSWTTSGKNTAGKIAAIQGLYSTQKGAPLVFFAYPTLPPPQLRAPVEIPGLLSWLAFGDIGASIKGINEFPADEIPPLWPTFVSYHNMVLLGMYFIAVMGLGIYSFVERNSGKAASS